MKVGNSMIKVESVDKRDNALLIHCRSKKNVPRVGTRGFPMRSSWGTMHLIVMSGSIFCKSEMLNLTSLCFVCDHPGPHLVQNMFPIVLYLLRQSLNNLQMQLVTCRTGNENSLFLQRSIIHAFYDTYLLQPFLADSFAHHS